MERLQWGSSGHASLGPPLTSDAGSETLISTGSSETFVSPFLSSQCTPNDPQEQVYMSKLKTIVVDCASLQHALRTRAEGIWRRQARPIASRARTGPTRRWARPTALTEPEAFLPTASSMWGAHWSPHTFTTGRAQFSVEHRLTVRVGYNWEVFVSLSNSAWLVFFPT